MDLKERTTYLKTSLERLKKHYETNEKPENRRDKAFFLYVREETEPIFQCLDVWESETREAVKQRQLKLHPQQIESTKENMGLLLMHSYYIDVRRKRYMQLYKSIVYIFDQQLKELA